MTKRTERPISTAVSRRTETHVSFALVAGLSCGLTEKSGDENQRGARSTIGLV